MSITAFLLILISAFMHAGWNFLSKANHPTIAFFVVVNGTIAILTIPFLFLAGIPYPELGRSFWLLLAGSILFETLAVVGLAGAYRKQDISIAYPLARALPVLLVAVTTMLFGIGQRPGLFSWIGFAIVAAGCVLLPQSGLQILTWQNFLRTVSGSILLAAIGTTGYTVVDNLAIAILKNHAAPSGMLALCAYLCLMEAGLTLVLLLMVLFSPREKADLRRSCRLSAPYLCGIFSGAAYLLVLVAMNFVTNVSFLQAFRQMSLPIGVTMGVVLLHEKLSLPKIIGTLLIVAGLIFTVIPSVPAAPPEAPADTVPAAAGQPPSK